MTESGFVKAQSDNLPKIDAFMMTTYLASNPDFTSAEVKGVKAARSQRESYGDSAAALATKEQNDCRLWHELRYGRITASKAYEAAHCNVLDGSLTENILGASKLRDTEAMKRGRLLESQVLKEVEKIKQIKINKCGLKLNAAYPTMGASPDGESTVYSIEIKCPMSEKALRHYITVKNEVAPKYMAQLQLQMHFSNKAKGLFCVAHNDYEITKRVTIIEVAYDKQFCETLLEKCIKFWDQAIFPKITLCTFN